MTEAESNYIENNKEGNVSVYKMQEDLPELEGQTIGKESEKTGRKHISRYILTAFSIILILILISSGAIYYYVENEKGNVIKNTFIQFGNLKDEDISSLNKEGAANKVSYMIEEILSQDVKLSLNQALINTRFRDLGVKIYPGTILEDVKEYMYGSNIINSLKMHHDNSSRTIKFEPNFSIDEEILNSFIKASLGSTEKKPQDADLLINKDGKFEIKKEISGYTLDKQKLEDNILNAVRKSGTSIDVPLKELSPSITENYLKAQIPEKLISTFTTYYGGSDTGRKDNIRLGASLINNTLLKPGEEFEFFKSVGDTSANSGFKPAGAFLNGKVITDIGGGLCQVSTTLYNAALLADLKITARSPHGLPVHYVPLGLDATVSEGVVTLKFKNTTGKYLLIKSSTDNDMLTFNLYGYMPEGKSVKVYAKSAGDNSADAYRDVYMNGQKVREDYLGRSTYKTPEKTPEQQ